MATKSIAWNTGTGNIILTYTGQGDGSIVVSSDDNTLGSARSQVITVETVGGAITRNLTVQQAACPFPVGQVKNFSYTGSYQEVELPAGTYKLQCWGAQGGSNGTNSTYGITAQAGGKGGYSEGVLTLTRKTTVRVYVGGQGSASAGGFNGGGGTAGTSQYNNGNEFGYTKMGGGGGATDIRLSDGALLSRMIVAGGGSGGAMCYQRVTNTIETVIADNQYVDGVWVQTDGTVISNQYRASTDYISISQGEVLTKTVTDHSYGYAVIYNSSKVFVRTVLNTDTSSTYTVQSGEAYVRYARYSSSGYGSRTPAKMTISLTEIVIADNQYVDGVWVQTDGTVINNQYRASTDYISISQGEVLTKTVTDHSYGYAVIYNSSKVFVRTVLNTDTSSTYTVQSGEAYARYVRYSSSGYGSRTPAKMTISLTTITTDTGPGFYGGGTTAGGYTGYSGKQNAAGSGGSFGQGANQTATNYRYCSGAGGGGWYGGGGGQKSDSSMTYCKYSGGGSGWVNIAASAGSRPSGYVGLQLDSGETKAGNTSFPSTSGGTETGHSGNGYAKITRLA